MAKYTYMYWVNLHGADPCFVPCDEVLYCDSANSPPPTPPSPLEFPLGFRGELWIFSTTTHCCMWKVCEPVYSSPLNVWEQFFVVFIIHMMLYSVVYNDVISVIRNIVLEWHDYFKNMTAQLQVTISRYLFCFFQLKESRGGWTWRHS